MYIKILCRVALTHAQDNPVGNPAAVRIDAARVQRLLDSTKEAMEKLKIEMKAQKIADTHGAIGWKTVKEYEVPELGGVLYNFIKNRNF